MNKEQVYDEKIHPLVDRLVAICNEHKIAMVANFHLDPGLSAITTTYDETGKIPPDHAVVVTILQEGMVSAIILDDDGNTPADPSVN